MRGLTNTAAGSSVAHTDTAKYCDTAKHCDAPNATPPRGTIPTTTPTIRCRRCTGDGRELVDVYVGTRGGLALYRLKPQDCSRCHGRGYLAYHPRPDSHPMPRPAARHTANPSPAGNPGDVGAGD